MLDFKVEQETMEGILFMTLNPSYYLKYYVNQFLSIIDMQEQ